MAFIYFLLNKCYHINIHEQIIINLYNQIDGSLEKLDTNKYSYTWSMIYQYGKNQEFEQNNDYKLKYVEYSL